MDYFINSIGIINKFAAMENKLRSGLLRLLVTTATLLVADRMMDSVHFDQPWIAILTAFVLALLNTFLKPVLIILTIPATLLTLGLFLLVINAGILMIAAELVNGFHLEGFWNALILAIIISAANAIMGGNVKVESNRLDK
jgi:putative membrane protein